MTRAVLPTPTSPAIERCVTAEARRVLEAPGARPDHRDLAAFDPFAVARARVTVDGADLLVAARNTRLMHLLERIAVEFNQAGVPLMVLKGGALLLTVYENPHERTMSDLDLLVRPRDIEKAFSLMEKLGGLRGESPVREDFFPRFHYETDYVFGTVYPTKIDLHVRPFRPLRYAGLVPDNAFFEHAVTVPIGAGTVLMPSREEMLIHLAVHAAVHGASSRRWLEDIRRWAAVHRETLDWDRFVETAKRWGLALPVLRALRSVERLFPDTLPPEVPDRLSCAVVSWRDRLALWHAPRDASHPAAHVAVNLLTAVGLRYRLSYLGAILTPGEAHMSGRYPWRHRGWLIAAHALRILGPLLMWLPLARRWWSRVEVRPSPIHGVGVFAAGSIARGEVISRYHGRPVNHEGTYTVWDTDESGRKRRYEITGKLRFLNHSCNPNARLSERSLVALRSIGIGQEITIQYDGATCNCGRKR